MGPTIILDKSAFQSLSYEEMRVLHQYYCPVIVPTFFSELKGDLAKHGKHGGIKHVSKLATMCITNQIDVKVSVDYRELLVYSLLGYEVKLEKIPYVRPSFVCEGLDGEKHALIEDTDEENALHRWVKGFISDEEFEQAEQIRGKHKDSNLKNLKSVFRNSLKELPPWQQKAIEDYLGNVSNFLEQVLSDSDAQTQLLKDILEFFPTNPEYATKIFLRWEQSNISFLKDFSSYAYFCIKLLLSFWYNIVGHNISDRATNVIDLEYLFYLPFCMIFVSDDKFHKEMLPCCLKDEQTFLLGKDLKADLHRLRFDKQPGMEAPIDQDSLTYKLWEKHLGYSQASQRLSKKLEDKMRQLFDIQGAIKNYEYIKSQYANSKITTRKTI